MCRQKKRLPLYRAQGVQDLTPQDLQREIKAKALVIKLIKILVIIIIVLVNIYFSK